MLLLTVTFSFSVFELSDEYCPFLIAILCCTLLYFLKLSTSFLTSQSLSVNRPCFRRVLSLSVCKADILRPQMKPVLFNCPPHSTAVYSTKQRDWYYLMNLQEIE